VNATTEPAARRRRQLERRRTTLLDQYQRATVAELVRLIALCDQKDLDFDKLVDDAQEVYRGIKADKSSPLSCDGRPHERRCVTIECFRPPLRRPAAPFP
jgi:hypothetical protein